MRAMFLSLNTLVGHIVLCPLHCRHCQAIFSGLLLIFLLYLILPGRIQIGSFMHVASYFVSCA